VLGGCEGAADVIRTEKTGRVRTCRIEPEGPELAEQWISERRALWARRLDRLGDVLAEEQAEPPPQSPAPKRKKRP
jgi:hypothetical protein